MNWYWYPVIALLVWYIVSMWRDYRFLRKRRLQRYQACKTNLAFHQNELDKVVGKLRDKSLSDDERNDLLLDLDLALWERNRARESLEIYQ